MLMARLAWAAWVEWICNEWGRPSVCPSRPFDLASWLRLTGQNRSRECTRKPRVSGAFFLAKSELGSWPS